MPLTNRTLILFKYFWETTDEVHPVSIADISAHLKEHGITALAAIRDTLYRKSHQICRKI